MTKEAELPARFLGHITVPIGRFEVSMNLVDSPKSFKLLKIRFESRMMALTNLAIFGVAVGATVLEVEFDIEDRYSLTKY